MMTALQPLQTGRSLLLGMLAAGYHWLGHGDAAFTELAAFRDAEPPGIAYARSLSDVERFVERFPDRMVCYGLNPRPRILRNARGVVRAARETDIQVSQSLLLDLDSQEPGVLPELASWIETAGAVYWTALGIKPPAVAFTGRGYHLLFAYPPVEVNRHPGLRDQLRAVRLQFVAEHRQDLARLETRVDATQDLRRLVRVYGTAKPGVGVKSELLAKQRVPDPQFRDYLLNLKVEDSGAGTVSASLPDWFPGLLGQDALLRAYWEGRGKQRGDTSRSGYDFSMVRRLFALGYTDFAVVGRILAARPGGVVQRRGKGAGYVRRTLANAVRAHQFRDS